MSLQNDFNVVASPSNIDTEWEEVTALEDPTGDTKVGLVGRSDSLSGVDVSPAESTVSLAGDFSTAVLVDGIGAVDLACVITAVTGQLCSVIVTVLVEPT